MKKLFGILLALVLIVGVSADTVPINRPLTLTCTADGTQPFTYQWYVDGVALVGKTQSTLIIANFDSSTNGVYSCKVTNYMGSGLSNLLPLTAAVPGAPPTNIVIKVTP